MSSLSKEYAKWDRLELSDDSDIEVHPNVDKKSFIRAKQHQIHEQRHQRKVEIETLKYERIINDGLLERINALLDALKKHKDESNSKNPDELVFQALIESAGDPAKDQPPAPPAGVYTQQKEPQPRYSKMMGSLIDQVKKEVDQKSSSQRFQDYIDGVRGHLTKVQNLQQELLVKLASLEKEDGAKITSEGIRDGFNVSSVAKAKPPPEKPAPKEKQLAKPKHQTVELLNPSTSGLATREPLQRTDSGISSGAEADVEDDSLLDKHEGATDADEDEDDVAEEEEDDDDDDDDDDEGDVSSIKLTDDGRKFSQIKIGDYRACLQFISEHPGIMNEATQDALLVEAFNAQMKSKDMYAKQCVHQGLLVQYCRQLGRDGVGMFFKRITTKGHQAQQVFSKDVADTYARIKLRAGELSKEEASAKNDPAGVEQIQLHAVEPGTEIHINVPKANSDDPIEQEARKIFDNFPPGLRKALKSGTLDEVNKVLGKMSVDEAEEIVELLGQGGMLSLQEGIIDATNEEGQKRLKELEEEQRLSKETGEPGDEVVSEAVAASSKPSSTGEQILTAKESQ